MSDPTNADHQRHMDIASELPEVKAPPSRARRAIVLLVIMVVAFGWPLLNSTLFFLNPDRKSHVTTATGTTLWLLAAIIYALAALGLLVWILRRQGRGLRDIGLSFSWKDIPVSILLLASSFVILYVTLRAMYYGYHYLTGHVLNYHAKNIDALHLSVSVVVIVFIVVNAFFEELLARAYLMTEVEFLTRSRVAAVLVSAAFQASYHLYQGIPSAFLIFVTFLIFSLYFIRWKRILPVILAHMFMDLLALAFYARR